MPVAGASIDLEKTSSDYQDRNTAYFWNRLSFWNYARPPSVILEVGLEPESGDGTQGKSWGKNNSQLGAGSSEAEVSLASGGTPLEKESGVKLKRTGDVQHCLIW